MVSKEIHAPSEGRMCEASILLLSLFTQVRGREQPAQTPHTLFSVTLLRAAKGALWVF